MKNVSIGTRVCIVVMVLAFVIGLATMCGGCATSVTSGFYGAKMVTGSIVPRGKGGGGCALVEGWGVSKVTDENVNCLCMISVINDSTKLSMQTMNFAPVAAFFVADKEMCDPNHKTE
jgi:hypothetical protein